MKGSSLERPVLPLEKMVAHEGRCYECGGIVKMLRDREGKLCPEYCFCIGDTRRVAMHDITGLLEAIEHGLESLAPPPPPAAA